MKLVTFAIASIVDANTHYLHHDDRPDYQAAMRHGREIRGKSVLQSLRTLVETVRNAVDRLRVRTREKREVASMLQMSDALLEDIGLQRSDLIAVHYGITSLAELQARRQAREAFAGSRKTIRSVAVSIGSDDNAANEAVFTPAKCA